MQMKLAFSVVAPVVLRTKRMPHGLSSEDLTSSILSRFAERRLSKHLLCSVEPLETGAGTPQRTSRRLRKD